jgi:hypothetical protein
MVFFSLLFLECLLEKNNPNSSSLGKSPAWHTGVSLQGTEEPGLWSKCSTHSTVGECTEGKGRKNFLTQRSLSLARESRMNDCSLSPPELKGNGERAERRILRDLKRGCSWRLQVPEVAWADMGWGQTSHSPPLPPKVHLPGNTRPADWLTPFLFSLVPAAGSRAQQHCLAMEDCCWLVLLTSHFSFPSPSTTMEQLNSPIHSTTCLGPMCSTVSPSALLWARSRASYIEVPRDRTRPEDAGGTEDLRAALSEWLKAGGAQIRQSRVELVEHQGEARYPQWRWGDKISFLSKMEGRQPRTTDCPCTPPSVLGLSLLLWLSVPWGKKKSLQWPSSASPVPFPTLLLNNYLTAQLCMGARDE